MLIIKLGWNRNTQQKRVYIIATVDGAVYSAGTLYTRRLTICNNNNVT